MKTKLLSALAFAAAATVSQYAAAVDGTISFTGSITAQTCTANGNGTSSKDFTVALPNVSSGLLATAGNVAGATPFSISLTGCNPDSGNVRTFFEAGPTVDATTGRLIVASGSGAASNVQIGLFNADDDSEIKAGFADASQNSHSVPLVAGSPAGSAGSATMRYIARYVSTGAATGGAVNSSVQYTIVYP
ncbi:major type 1 subunit fimbrin (pilin) [Cupriavidus sp. YR651]|uniref:fimbrial protein n=1 Tax=Cupriavidus sp. YR651 TaxID=1855315 RepID=UPI00088FEAD6|nr:fimbrial protein [Cupriavidus sp. YR651]SDD74872.1 major type 1 subunit fimbrin (pilin) [Cupriavidus sp. YR651]